MAIPAQRMKLRLDQGLELGALVVAIDADPGATVIHKVVMAGCAIHRAMICMAKSHGKKGCVGDGCWSVPCADADEHGDNQGN